MAILLMKLLGLYYVLHSIMWSDQWSDFDHCSWYAWANIWRSTKTKIQSYAANNFHIQRNYHVHSLTISNKYKYKCCIFYCCVTQFNRFFSIWFWCHCRNAVVISIWKQKCLKAASNNEAEQLASAYLDNDDDLIYLAYSLMNIIILVFFFINFWFQGSKNNNFIIFVSSYNVIIWFYNLMEDFRLTLEFTISETRNHSCFS